eukprot:tig00000113_g5601.t1
MTPLRRRASAAWQLARRKPCRGCRRERARSVREFFGLKKDFEADVPVRIVGRVARGEPLRVECNPKFVGNNTVGIAWSRGDAAGYQPVPFGVGPLYVPSCDDMGRFIRCEVSFMNAAGQRAAPPAYFDLGAIPLDPALVAAVDRMVSSGTASFNCQQRVANGQLAPRPINLNFERIKLQKPEARLPFMSADVQPSPTVPNEFMLVAGQARAMMVLSSPLERDVFVMAFRRFKLAAGNRPLRDPNAGIKSAALIIGALGLGALGGGLLF